VTGEIGAGADVVLFTGGSLANLASILPISLACTIGARREIRSASLGLDRGSKLLQGLCPRLGSTQPSRRNWKFRVVGDLFKVVVLTPSFFFAFVIAFKNCRLLPCLLLAGQAVVQLSDRPMRLHRLQGFQTDHRRDRCWRSQRLGFRLTLSLLSFPLTLFSCKPFADCCIKFFLGKNPRRLFCFFSDFRRFTFASGVAVTSAAGAESTSAKGCWTSSVIFESQ
jgi:hypothetical protein